MLFSSIPFLYYFLPCVLFVYFIVPKAFKNAVLLISSLIFYAWGEPTYVILMIITIAVGYGAGLLMERAKTKAQAKTVLIVSVGICLAFLGYFKYADFFIENFSALTGLSIPALRLALPIGISFYTFQIVSYIIDVYRRDVKARKNPVALAAYVTMFPQLIAGPIVRYSDIEKELDERTHSFEMAAAGIRRFVIGLSKKVLVANILGELCDVFKASNDTSVLFFWLYAIAFSLHLYFDFSGYSDMAIGLGKLFGFHFPENFNYPFISKSVAEFWRRWHMSLGTWFRDYVYIPMGGNRVKLPRWFLNTFTVWFLTGFWHGAGWNFIVWGLMFAVLLVLEKLWLKKWLDKLVGVRHIYVLFFILISFVIFNAADMGEAMRYIGSMLGFGGVPMVSAEFFYYLRSYGVILLVAAIGSTPIIKAGVNKLASKLPKLINTVEPIVLVVLTLLITAYLVDGSFNPFLYFRF